MIDLSRAVSWNPHIGCTRVSSGCKNCRAGERAVFLRRRGVEEYAGIDFYSGPVLVESRLLLPAEKKKPTVFWLDTMSDLFHENISDDEIGRIIGVIANHPRHLFLCATKRAARLQKFTANWLAAGGVMPGNLWCGVSVEDAETWRERAPLLKRAFVARRFVLAEPLVGVLSDISDDIRMLDWVLCGGEVGRRGVARPLAVSAAAALAATCARAGVPFYFLRVGSFSAEKAPFWFASGTDGDRKQLDSHIRRNEFAQKFPYYWRAEAPKWVPSAA